MPMAASVAIYSGSPPTVSSGSHSSVHCTSSTYAEMDSHGRLMAPHTNCSKPVLGGLSSLLASPSARSTSEAMDLSPLSTLAWKGSHFDQASIWDVNENWSDSLGMSAAAALKLRERSPVSVFHGPFSCSSEKGFCRTGFSRDRISNGAWLTPTPDHSFGISHKLCSWIREAQQPLLRMESDYSSLTRGALASHLDNSASCDLGEEIEVPEFFPSGKQSLQASSPTVTRDFSSFTEVGHSNERPSSLANSNSSVSVIFSKPLFQETPKTAVDILQDAQEGNDIFKDPFVVKAFREAERAHSDQFRATGDPYLVHCVETAMILASVGASKVVVAAGLLHDVIDDSTVDYQHLQDLFGPDVADLVEGVSRLSEFSQLARESNMASRTAEADLLHTMFLAMADVRVVLIKLADRLHNMRTLGALPHEKRYRIATETFKVFAPLANRLGIWSWKAELEDLCFKNLKHQEYQELTAKLAEGFREATILSAITKLDRALHDKGLVHHDLSGRHKNLFSIYSKMLRKGTSVDEICDVRGLRLIVEDERECYTALQTVHQLWSHIPGKLKDYIRQPKFNGYQSLHTVVLGEDGLPLEIQIRTKEMHYQAEFGLAAHWRYKEGNVQHPAFILQMVEWARWVLTWQNEVMDTKVRLSPFETDLRSLCPFPFHQQGCPHSELFHGPPQNEGDPLFVIILEDEKMVVQELPGGSTVLDLLLRRADEDSLTATCGAAFCEELRPRVNHTVIDDIQQRLRMGDLVEMTSFIPDKSLSEYREKIKRMFGDCNLQEDEIGRDVQHTLSLPSEIAMA